MVNFMCCSNELDRLGISCVSSFGSYPLFDFLKQRHHSNILWCFELLILAVYTSKDTQEHTIISHKGRGGATFYLSGNNTYIIKVANFQSY